MDAAIRQALASDLTIDITTTGRRSGRPRRLEIWFHEFEGRWYITGSPGTRDWHANMLANPQFTFHLKESLQADLAARAIPVRDEVERRRVLGDIFAGVDTPEKLESRVAGSPLVEVVFE
ncbi:MAG: nitroreductase/quinone reductase family protein [Anaerolineaceae bacterium]|nr:nitroreductase/quinone reductase family protein [Anaerolineaceae bacterium]MCY3908456.1 nitroreductase/quinone reductase family protein [Anaerolineaceae bacterium]